LARGTVSAADFAARIDAARQMPDAAATLAAMLPEQSAAFAGRGSNEVERVRGYILASFETVGLPPEAVPFVLEELETGQNIYTVAAAARALRGAREVPADAPDLLVGAIERLRGSDDVVMFDRFEPAPAATDPVTALTELARTLVLLGPRASQGLPRLKTLVGRDDKAFSPALRVELGNALEAITQGDAPHPPCCSAHDGAKKIRPVDAAVPSDFRELALENQDGRRRTLWQAFSGRPSAIAFFYTRCMNPQKCSLTVTRLGRLAERLGTEELDANVAGITYDPGFDRAARLKAYGSDRGMIFSARCSLLRTVGPFGRLADAFDLGVGFGPVTVNRHRLDLIILDASLRIPDRFERRLWHEETVLDALRAATTPK
jgi:protein SCO1/2